MLFWSEGIVLLPYIYYTKENVNVVLVFYFHVFLDHIKNYKTALKIIIGLEELNFGTKWEAAVKNYVLG
jgi:hypothetical protein